MATTIALDKSSQPQDRLSMGVSLIWAIALANLALHIYFNNRYSYFRDEFDYIACGRHLGFGYVTSRHSFRF